jgi:hypothetical protein
MRCEVVGAFKRTRFLISDSHPESPHWRASLLQNSNRVENYLFSSASFGLCFRVCACPKVLATVAMQASETSRPAEKLLFIAVKRRARAVLISH